jgi:DNA replication protein DnaC
MNNTETPKLNSVNTIFGKLEIRQVKASCPLHGEYLANEVWLGGQLKEVSECPECFKLNKAQRAIEEEKARKEETEKNRLARIKESRMPLEYQVKDFSTFITETESQRNALAMAKRFVNGWEKAKAGGYGLLLLGGCGTGKTHLACAIMLELLDKYACLYPRYYKVTEIFSAVRNTYQQGATTNEEETIKFFSSIQLLVIDEVGVQKGSEAEKRILFSILDNRVTSNKPTILMSNLGPKALAELLGDRLYDRVRSKCVPMLFAGPSMRKPATADLFD